MPIVVRCDCGTVLRARDEQAGRTCRCPRCGASLDVPYPVATVIPPPHQPQPPKPALPPNVSPVTAAVLSHRSRTGHTAPPVPAEPPPPQVHLSELQKCERTFRGHFYWILLLFVIPLIYATFVSTFTIDTVKQMLRKQVDSSPTTAIPAEDLADEAADADEDLLSRLDEIVDKAPGKRLEGAFLARDSWAHWLFAFAATVVFFAVVALAIPCEEVPLRQLVIAGVFTATLGVALLLTFQHFGMCFCLISVWYIAAMHPDAPFGPSLLGFVLGVGVCEEITKCIPVLWRIHRQDVGWREACLIGMASGAGFGISEGIHYCNNLYNGVAPLSIYLVRFLSTCGLHVILSGACGIMIFRKQKHLSDWFDPYDWVLTMSALMIVPIVLHGLFNALLKVELDAAALGVWLAAFAWLAWMIKVCRRDELKDATVAVVHAACTVKTQKGTRYVGRDLI